MFETQAPGEVGDGPADGFGVQVLSDSGGSFGYLLSQCRAVDCERAAISPELCSRLAVQSRTWPELVQGKTHLIESDLIGLGR